MLLKVPVPNLSHQNSNSINIDERASLHLRQNPVLFPSQTRINNVGASLPSTSENFNDQKDDIDMEMETDPEKFIMTEMPLASHNNAPLRRNRNNAPFQQLHLVQGATSEDPLLQYLKVPGGYRPIPSNTESCGSLGLASLSGLVAPSPALGYNPH